MNGSSTMHVRQTSRLLLVVFALAFGRSPWLIGADSAAVEAPPLPTKRQNVVMIVLDDVGFAELGCFGSEIRTPNIDRLAQHGLRYSRFDTKAICSPTRASLLTGRNSHAVRMSDLPSRLGQPDPNDLGHGKGELPDNAETLAEALQRSGYSTFAFGKWHLSPAYDTGEPGKDASFPLQRGFDAFYGFKMGWTDQYTPKLYEGNRPVPAPVRPGYHLSEDLVDRAISTMKASRSRAPDQPMFVYLALGVAHSPIQAPREYIERYATTYQKGWDDLRAERFARMKRLGIIPANTILPPRESGDPSWESLTDPQRRVFARFMATYAGFLEHGDAQIGRLLTHLEESGMARDTLVVLFSDNGAASESKGGAFRRPYGDNTTLEEMDAHLDELGTAATQALYQRAWAWAGSTPFRRYKLWPYLGGIRTPLIISWPAVIRDGGAIRRQYVEVVDLAPTILEAVGSQFRREKDGKPQLPVAGRSIFQTLTSPQAPAPRTVQFFELRGNRAITSGDWRAVAMHKMGTDFSKDRWQLFNLASDPSESTDLAATHREKLAEMIQLWWSEAEVHGALPLREPPAALRTYFETSFEDAFQN